MRISPENIEALIQVFTPHIGSAHAELRLYGSRVDPHRKGGDIDLLLLVQDPKLAQHLKDQKHYVLAQIKTRLGDQKIDLLISKQEDLDQDAFLKMILPTSLLLKSWPNPQT